VEWGNLELGGAQISDIKRRGEWAEIRFIAKAMEYGYRLTRPVGGSPPYDVVVDLGGQFISVQVKSTIAIRGRRKVLPVDCYSLTMRCGGHRYRLSDFHYVAAYIIPRDLWYIIPFALVIGRSTLLLRPDDPPDNGYERFREAWHLLGVMPPTIDPSLPVKYQRYRVRGGQSAKGRLRKTPEKPGDPRFVL